MSDALVPTTPRVAADQALGALTERQRAFVVAHANGQRASDAARAAGYADGAVAKVRRNPEVQRALGFIARARDAEAEVSHESACRLLEASLLVRVSDLFVYDDSGETPIGLRPRATLSPAEELRIVRYESKVHASAQGHRGGTRWLDVELVSPLEILDRLSKLRGWDPKSSTFQVLLAAVQAPVVENKHGASLALLHEMADRLLQGERLDRYLLAFTAGRQEEMAQLLAEGAAELAADRNAIDVEAVRE